VAGEPPLWGGQQGRPPRPHQGCPSRHHLGGPAGEPTLGPPRPHQGCPAAWVDGRLVVGEGSGVGGAVTARLQAWVAGDGAG